MILEKLTSSHLQDILTCLTFPDGHQVHLVSSVDGGTVSTTTSIISIVSPHLSAILKDQVSVGGWEESTVLVPVQSSVIRKMMTFITTGRIILNTIDEVFAFRKLTQMVGIRTAVIEVSKVREKNHIPINKEKNTDVIIVSKVKAEMLQDIKEKEKSTGNKASQVEGKKPMPNNEKDSDHNSRVEMCRETVKEMKKVNKKWVCQLCKKEFFKKNRCFDHLLRMHSLVTAPFSYTCEVCQVGFNYKCKLSRHQMTKQHKKLQAGYVRQKVNENSSIVSHHKFELPTEMKKVDGRWNCQLCSKGFRVDDRSACLRHLVKHHQIEIPTAFCCDVCRKGFFCKSDLRNHENGKRHNLKIKILNIQKWKEFDFVPIESLLEGNKIKSLEDVPKAQKQLSIYKKRQFLDGKWICLLCQNSFDLISKLNAHLDKVHNVNVVKKTCEICQVTFYNKAHDRLKLHLDTKSHLSKVAESIKVEREEKKFVINSCDPCMVNTAQLEKVVMKNRYCDKTKEIKDCFKEELSLCETKNNLNAETNTNSTSNNNIKREISSIIKTGVKNQDLVPLELLADFRSVNTRSPLQRYEPVVLPSGASQEYQEIQVEYSVETSGQVSERTNNDVDVKDISLKEDTVYIKFQCDDPRLGKSKVITLPDNKPVRKAMKKLSKVVGLNVNDLLFTVDGQAIDMTVKARKLEDVTVHVSRKYE